MFYPEAERVGAETDDHLIAETAKINAMAAQSQQIADELTRIEERNSGGVFATLHLPAQRQVAA